MVQIDNLSFVNAHNLKGRNFSHKREHTLKIFHIEKPMCIPKDKDRKLEKRMNNLCNVYFFLYP